jgi:hypothetical protein
MKMVTGMYPEDPVVVPHVAAGNRRGSDGRGKRACGVDGATRQRNTLGLYEWNT